MKPVKTLDGLENDLVAKLGQNPVLKNLNKLTNEQVENLLLQRAQFSFEFTKLYDCALRGVEDPTFQRVLEWLVREEYPQNELNHRKALVLDLYALGLSKQKVLTAKPSEQTQQCIQTLYGLVSFADQETDVFYDIKVAAGLRLGMEVMVAEEYELFLEELCDPKRGYNFTKEKSVFYAPHALHDKKVQSIEPDSQRVDQEVNHNAGTGAVLARLVKNEQTLQVAAMAMWTAYDAKASFYDQFSCFLGEKTSIQD